MNKRDEIVQDNVLFAIEAVRKRIEKAKFAETITELNLTLLKLCEEYKSLKTFETK